MVIWSSLRLMGIQVSRVLDMEGNRSLIQLHLYQERWDRLTVIVYGHNFNSTPEGNIVYFGPVKAVVSIATPNMLQVIVPAGAVYDPVSVTSNYLTAISSTDFLVRFPESDSLISASSFSPVGNFNTGNYPVSVSIADLDQDGKPDLITANADSLIPFQY